MRFPAYFSVLRDECEELTSWAVTPLGVAHSVTEDDVYEGYLIPKGTTVLPNIWYADVRSHGRLARD